MLQTRDIYQEITEGLESIYPRLWRYCFVLTRARDMADELAQMVCLRALEKSHQFEPGSLLDRWLFTIAQRTWIDEIRKQAVRTGGGLVPIEESDLPATSPDPEMNLFHRQTLLSVMELPDAQRSTVMLVYIEGYSYKEAAETLGIPIGTVMSRLSIARKKLVESLTEERK